MIKVQEVQERFHCFSRDVLYFDFSSGCFNHTATTIAQHSFENFALITQDDLVQGLLYRWTEHSILQMPTGGGIFNPNNPTQTHSIFVKIEENTFFTCQK